MNSIDNGLTVLSLFDGISCGQIALEKAGIKINKYFASEINKNAIKITQINYPNTIQLGNVENISSSNLPKIDLLIGGSPCQGFSFAGKQLNFNDDRSKLFFQFVRLLKECNPSYFLLENVIMKKQYRDIISLYLNVNPIEINSSIFSAQHRVRLYWTNIKIDHIPKDKGLLLKDIIINNVPQKYIITDRFYKKTSGTLSYKKSRSNIRTIYQKSKPLLTAGHNISNTGSTNIYFNNNFIRIPMPIECERLQTIPDNYTDYNLTDSERYNLIGNAWTVDVIAYIFNNLKLQYGDNTCGFSQLKLF